MGASNYNSSNTGKTRRSQRQKTPMEEMIEKMKKVEERRQSLESAREGLENAENQFVEAEDALRKSEAEVRAQIARLDPESQVLLRDMLNRLNQRDRQDNDRDDR